MPAMHDLVLSAMNERLEYWRDVMLRTLEFEMTHDECINLVAPSEHVTILKEASKVANVKASQSWMHLIVPADVDGMPYQSVQLYMHTHAEQEPPLMPRDPQWQPGQAGPKVIEWLDKRYKLGRRFGTARHVLYTLARECETGHQLRYMWPAVLNLCHAGGGDKMEKWMERFAAYKPCRHTPAVSREFKLAIQDSSALLTSCALIGHDVPHKPVGAVQIGVYSMGSFAIDSANVLRI